MLRLLFLLLITALAIGFGPRFAGYQGLAILRTKEYQIETSISVLCMFIFAAITLILFLLWIIRKSINASSATTGWFLGRSSKRARKQTKAGLLRLIEGDYQRAEKLFSLSASNSEQPLVNYLLAAEAAQRRRDIMATNQYLEQAELVAGNNKLPVDITRIHIQMANGAYEAARYGIERLLAVTPRQPEVLRLAHKAYLKTNAYQDLLEIIPSMRKISLYDDNTIDNIETQAYEGVMQQEIAHEGSEGLKRWLNQLSRSQRQSSKINQTAAALFIQYQDYQMAEETILSGLKQQPDEALIKLIPKLTQHSSDKLEKALEKISSKQGNSATINRALGCLAYQNKNWQAASEYLHNALLSEPDAKGYALLANTYDELSQSEDAAQARKKGLELILN